MKIFTFLLLVFVQSLSFGQNYQQIPTPTISPIFPLPTKIEDAVYNCWRAKGFFNGFRNNNQATMDECKKTVEENIRNGSIIFYTEKQKDLDLTVQELKQQFGKLPKRIGNSSTDIHDVYYFTADNTVIIKFTAKSPMTDLEKEQTKSNNKKFTCTKESLFSKRLNNGMKIKWIVLSPDGEQYTEATTGIENC